MDAVVQRVADARMVKAYGAVTTVARQLNLDPRLVQKWVNKATAPPRQASRPSDGIGSCEIYLSPGLLHCRFCRQLMNAVDGQESVPGYQCRQDCRPRPLDAAAIADAVGRAILRHAPRIVPPSGTPTPPCLAAIHAHLVLNRITVGTTPTELTLTWRASPMLKPDQLRADPAQRIATARKLSRDDPLHARQLLHDSLTGIDPATAPADPLLAEAAILLTELQLRLGHVAIVWATYAHHSTTHLYGATHRHSLHALHLLALAYRHAGQHQRAYHLYRQLADHHTRTNGPHAPRTLAVKATTALVLHALGHCQAARTLLADTITVHRREHPDHPATSRMIEHLTRVWRDCDAKGHEHSGGRASPLEVEALLYEREHR
ncbi:tetratricopeptide repeat protein [Micromonospora globbae]|uniref:tetratricopeptide repeat protein n=1 Tax=Micromonospora globbae TaxID=1894969 RepID=UPI00344552DA